MEITDKGIKEMEKYGGSFVKALAEAWRHADHINKKKIEETFDYFEQYQRAANERAEP